KSQNEWVSKAKKANDTQVTLYEIETGQYPLVVLIGGPGQNNITEVAEDRGWINEAGMAEGGVIVESGRVANGSDIIAISDHQGFDTLPRQNVDRSPLSAVMSKEDVRIAATVISLLLLVAFNILRTVFEFKALDIGRKGKKVGEGAYYFRGINLTEAAAIIGASVILGISMSWQYFAGGGFLDWLII